MPRPRSNQPARCGRRSARPRPGARSGPPTRPRLPATRPSPSPGSRRDAGERDERAARSTSTRVRHDGRWASKRISVVPSSVIEARLKPVARRARSGRPGAGARGRRWPRSSGGRGPAVACASGCRGRAPRCRRRWSAGSSVVERGPPARRRGRPAWRVGVGRQAVLADDERVRAVEERVGDRGVGAGRGWSAGAGRRGGPRRRRGRRSASSRRRRSPGRGWSRAPAATRAGRWPARRRPGGRCCRRVLGGVARR